MFSYGVVIMKENLYKDVFAFFVSISHFLKLDPGKKSTHTHFALTTLAVKTRWKVLSEFKRIKGPPRKDYFTSPSVYWLLL
jgi:hypothetical protein